MKTPIKCEKRSVGYTEVQMLLKGAQKSDVNMNIKASTFCGFEHLSCFTKFQ